MLTLTRNFPRIRGFGLVANVLKRFYLRKARGSITTDVLGFRMVLDPTQSFDGELLFYPQICDYREVRFIQGRLKEGGIFLDIGANIGFYSLFASRIVGPAGVVIAIEADPYNCDRLKENIALNSCHNVEVVGSGVSDARECLRLGVDPAHRGGSSFLRGGAYGIQVECAPLLEIVSDRRLPHVDGLKIDIEGFEFRVLKRFFEDADSTLYPQFMIVERQLKWIEKGGGDVVELLTNQGYKIHSSSKLNFAMSL